MQEDRKNTLKILEEHYRAAQEQESSWYFFLNTAEYIKFACQTPYLSEIIREWEEQQKRAYEAFEVIDNKAIKELENSVEVIEEAIKNINASLEPVNNLINEVNMLKEGRMFTSMPTAHFLNLHLADAARFLKQNGFQDIVERFEDINEKQRNIYGDFTFSPTLRQRDKAEKELESERERELWGTWESFPFIKRVFFDSVDIEEELDGKEHKDRLATWEFVKALGPHAELEYMREHKDSERDFIHFKKDDFKRKLNRIHRCFITELLSGKEEPAKCSFDASRSVLEVNEVEITFRKHTEQYHTLRIMFEHEEEIGKEWFFSEIGERIDPYKSYTDKKIHNYISAIKKRVAVEAGIKDLFITTSQSVKIDRRFFR